MTDSEIVRSTGSFTDPEIELFKANRHMRLFKKKEQLLPAGQISRSVYFLKKGAIVQYKIVGENKKQYTNLQVAGEWVFSYKSLISQSPAESCIEAFTECEVMELSLYAIHKLIEQSAAFLVLNRALASLAERIDFFEEDSSPARKYEDLMQQRPQIVQTFPLKAIASYLKISPETLSRVRSQV